MRRSFTQRRPPNNPQKPNNHLAPVGALGEKHGPLLRRSCIDPRTTKYHLNLHNQDEQAPGPFKREITPECSHHSSHLETTDPTPKAATVYDKRPHRKEIKCSMHPYKSLPVCFVFFRDRWCVRIAFRALFDCLFGIRASRTRIRPFRAANPLAFQHHAIAKPHQWRLKVDSSFACADCVSWITQRAPHSLDGR